MHFNRFHLHKITYMCHYNTSRQCVSSSTYKNQPTAGIKCPSTKGSGHSKDYRAFFKINHLWLDKWQVGRSIDRLIYRHSVGEAVGKTGAVIHCWWKCKLAQYFCRKTLQCLTKLHMHLTFDPAIPLIGNDLEGIPLTIQNYVCTGHLLQHCL